MRADGHALTQLELRDGLAGLGDHRLLAGDGGEVGDRAVDDLGVLGGLADAHVDDDLHETRHLHDVPVLELLLQGAADLVAVLGLQTRGDLLGLLHLGHHSSFPEALAKRTFTVLLTPSFSTVSKR